MLKNSDSVVIDSLFVLASALRDALGPYFVM